MKDREYYERLISDSLDRALSKAEAEELKQALRYNPDLDQFRQEAIRQAGVIRSLPDFSIAAALRLPREKAKSPSFFQSLWNIRVSLPLPVATLLLLVFLGIGLFEVLANGISKAPGTKQRAKEIEYVRIERLKPAKAVLIQQSQDEKRSNEEAL